MKVVIIPKNTGSGHNTPIPTKEVNPAPAMTALLTVFLNVYSGVIGSTTSFLTSFFLASNIGNGFGLGHNF